MRGNSLRRSGLSNVGSVLKSNLDSLGMRHKIAEQQAIEKWSEVVGADIAAVTHADQVRDGRMFVSCKSSMWASELTLHTPDILKKLERAVGRKVITDISFGARGFRRTQPSEEPGPGMVEPENIRLSKAATEAAAEAASVAEARELADRIEKAMLAVKRREKAMESESRDKS